MPSASDLHNWAERAVLDSNGKEIGYADGFYNDDRTGEPAFMLVRGGLFGNHLHFVPLLDASHDGEQIKVAWDADTINHAPKVKAGDHLSPEEEQRLFSHYGISEGHDGDVIVLTRITIVTT
jgi:hypothetical protein